MYSEKTIEAMNSETVTISPVSLMNSDGLVVCNPPSNPVEQ